MARAYGQAVLGLFNGGIHRAWDNVPELSPVVSLRCFAVPSVADQFIVGENRTSRTLSPLHQFWGKELGIMNVKAILTNGPRIRKANL